MSRPLYRIPVPSGSLSTDYEILVGAGIWRSLAAVIERHCPAHRYAIITDHNVAERYGARLLRALHAGGHSADVFAFPAGEEQKTRETWIAVSDAMFEAGLGRDAAVVALGGGVAGDLAGFVAATYMRGLPLIQLPTSLLAMLDASVGGKTGVNTSSGKNLVGAFWPPRVVVIDPEVLATLPEPHLRAGFAEAVKHGAIFDAEHLAALEERSEALLSIDAESLCEVVVRSVEIKARTVARDEREAGPRRALNFGHTIGHALEIISEYRMLHGEAVALGMVAEARIGERLGVTRPGTAEAIGRVLGRFGLPTRLPPEVSVERIVGASRADKKAREGRTEYVLLRAPGEVDEADGRWSVSVPDELVRDALAAG